ncbi:quinone oxidoreductase family protein [Rhodobium orientis]|uniref:Quinone oxidoreductase n=1 Tax=Rhodobium orientis TaxID=34017 RepID=A0A327JV70_9HYPH|nr:quinone oxidoreductase [Rhodobium orientis]MBK5949750.1 quinone oxidoreductase [Rhodobium orientis]RAI30137.1 quinone oxidoreductase [Rhodobium orientis]
MGGGLVAREPGGPEAMVWTDLPLEKPGPGEVVVAHTAVGVNFIDVYFRSGLYPWPETPMIPGAEASGVVEAVGPDVADLKVGDRVAYVLPRGAYREQRVLPAERLVPLPDGIDATAIAGAMLKGLTAHYLVTASYAVKPGDTVLVHAAAGGVGLILGQWLKALGVTAIGTAGGPQKVALAREHGYDHVIDYKSEDFVAEVERLTDGAGCEAVYDSVGADTWRGSLKCLKRRGMFVNFGQSSGMLRDFQMSDLAKGGSLSANRPMLFDYIVDRSELLDRSSALFDRILDGTIRLDVAATRRLKEAAAAHADLEARKTVGSTILVV